MDALQMVGALHLSGFQVTNPATNAAGDVMFDVEKRSGCRPCVGVRAGAGAYRVPYRAGGVGSMNYEEERLQRQLDDAESAVTEF